MSAIGRPSKFSDDVAQRIVDAVAGGNTMRTSAALAGVCYSTFRDWQKRGEDGEEPFVSFSARVEKAKAEAEAESVKIIRTASITSWQAAAWWLERRRYKDYGRKDQVHSRVEQVERMSDDELQRKYKVLRSEAEKEFSDDEAEAHRDAGRG